MMEIRRRLPIPGRPETGATLVEFALVAPIVFMLIFGLMAGTFLVYQNSALHDGATAGARAASIEASNGASLVTASGSQFCETGLPVSISKAVAQAAPLLKVNPDPLCSSSSPPAVLTQQNTVNGDINIQVTCAGTQGCGGTPDRVQVTLLLTTKGLVAPIGLMYHMKATSQVPVLTP